MPYTTAAVNERVYAGVQLYLQFYNKSDNFLLCSFEPQIYYRRITERLENSINRIGRKLSKATAKRGLLLRT